MIAQLHIQTAERKGKTVLETAFSTPPLKVADITEDKRKGDLRLMIMSSSPGILDGDEHRIRIDVGAGCHLELQTQSYQRLFPMKKGALQDMEVQMGRGSLFRFLPHPVVPHQGAAFSATNRIFLSPGSSLLWGEVVTCGRKLNNEVFLFSKYHAITEVFCGGRMIIKENLFICPALIDPLQLGQLEGYTHQASLIYLDERAPIKTMIDDTTGWLSLQQDIDFGITAAPGNGIIIRLLGQKAEQLHQCLKTIAGRLNIL